MDDRPEEGFAPVPGGQLFYERRGEGPALVLVHSGFLDRRMWEPQFLRFSDEFSVVRYDVRGYGRSTPAGDGYSDAADLHALLDRLAIERSFLIGISNGARIACEFAAGWPDRLLGVVLVGGNPFDLDPTQEEEQRFLDSFPDRGQRILDRISEGRVEEAVDAMLEAWAPAVPAAER